MGVHCSASVGRCTYLPGSGTVNARPLLQQGCCPAEAGSAGGRVGNSPNGYTLQYLSPAYAALTVAAVVRG
jgi:hypothetical protein